MNYGVAIMTELEIENSVIAKYVEGLSAAQISKSLGIPVDKVRKIVDKLQKESGEKLAAVNDFVMEQDLDSSLAELIHENTRAMKTISRQSQDQDYIADQSSASLGQLYEKIGNFTIRLLEAASYAKRREEK
jgi:DNA-binding transcriptional regulator LsrR (DeoR family)